MLDRSFCMFRTMKRSCPFLLPVVAMVVLASNSTDGMRIRSHWGNFGDDHVSMLQVSSATDSVELANSELYMLTGTGQCTDEDGNVEDIGWGPCEFGIGGCDSVDDCKAVCSADESCGAFNYHSGHCWLFSKMDKPYVKNNTAFNWYECYIKGAKAASAPAPEEPAAREVHDESTAPTSSLGLNASSGSSKSGRVLVQCSTDIGVSEEVREG